MYSWISEGSIAKYNRAVKVLKTEGKEVTEEAVKALYISYGGLVVEKPESVDMAEEVESEEDAPKKRSRKA